MIRTAFLGTPLSAIPTLEALDAVSEVTIVITMPDRPAGRSKRPAPAPVRLAAEELGLPVRTPHDRDELRQALADLELDVGIVTAFGMIIPGDVLAIPEHGMVNVHFSLLPRWRGAAPVERAMLAGDATTGVTLMAMDAGLDTGPTLAQWCTAIERNESAADLTERLAAAGAELLATSLRGIIERSIEPVAQDDALVTRAPRLETAEARIDWTMPATDIVQHVLAYNPRPGAFSFRGDERIKIHRAWAGSGTLEPGRILTDDQAIAVGSGLGLVHLLEVQPSGRKPMAALDWARGLRDLAIPFL